MDTDRTPTPGQGPGSNAEAFNAANTPEGFRRTQEISVSVGQPEKVHLGDLLSCVATGGSDLHLGVGDPPIIRKDGLLCGLVGPKDSDICLNETIILEYLKGIGLQDEHDVLLRERGQVDFAFHYQPVNCRFRVHIEKTHTGLSAVLRVIPSKILDFDALNTPQTIRNLIRNPNGIVLVVGPTGSGKTSTLAAAIDFINKNDPECHIYSLEAPIEFVHHRKLGRVTQRELGIHFRTFDEGIEASLRADPDVILVGEMRDPATMKAAIEAATTGHLVFSTLHTTGAVDTVNRIVNAFPTNQQENVRTLLADQLRGVISQVLIPRCDQIDDSKKMGRVAAYEVMVATPGIRNNILENKTANIRDAITTGSKYGMISLEASIHGHLVEGLISEKHAMDYAKDKTALQQLIESARRIH